MAGGLTSGRDLEGAHMDMCILERSEGCVMTSCDVDMSSISGSLCREGCGGILLGKRRRGSTSTGSLTGAFGSQQGVQGESVSGEAGGNARTRARHHEPFRDALHSMENAGSLGRDSWRGSAEGAGREAHPGAAAGGCFKSGRERLVNFRALVAGNISIPDTWTGDNSLQEWVDWTPVEVALRPKGLMLARSSLVNEHCGGRSAPQRADSHPRSNSAIEVQLA